LRQRVDACADQQRRSKFQQHVLHRLPHLRNLPVTPPEMA
jgi:hypothetical protein